MLAGELAQAADGASVHLAEPSGLADAAPLGDVLQDRFDLLRGQSGIEEGRSLTLGEAGLADAAAEHTSLLARAVAAGHGQISGPPPAMLGAVGIQAAEAREVIQGAAPPVRSSRANDGCVTPMRYTTGKGACNRVRPPRNFGGLSAEVILEQEAFFHPKEFGYLSPKFTSSTYMSKVF